jgi:hypothetical protein
MHILDAELPSMDWLDTLDCRPDGSIFPQSSPAPSGAVEKGMVEPSATGVIQDSTFREDRSSDQG